MKQGLCALLLTCLASSLAWAGTISNIPSENRAIIFDGHLSVWKPSTKQTTEALQKIQTTLETAGKGSLDSVEMPNDRTWELSQIKDILTYKDGYLVQFWGFKYAGKNLISCCFLSNTAQTNKFLSNWRTHPISILGGGSQYWQVVYDPETGSLVSFSVNGLD